MKYIFGFLILFLAQMAFGKIKSDVGYFVGTATYWGDINPSRIIYKPTVAGGFLYRYNLNKRYALRLNAYYAKINGADADFEERIIPHRDQARFATSLINLALQAEFNFLPINPTDRDEKGALYITGGIGYTFVLASELGGNNTVPTRHLNIPFGLGYKHYLTDRVGLGCEIGLRKTFSDNIDGVTERIDNTLFNNNDWYTFAGISLTYKFFNFAATCPAYND